MTNIVMLVRDRFKLTEQALSSLYHHTPREEYTLTIVDDGSQDFRTRLMCIQYTTGPKGLYVRLENSGHVLGELKNIGVYASDRRFGRGDYLYLSDNDVYFTPAWLKKLIQFEMYLDPNENHLVGGQIHPFHQQPKKPIQVLDGPSWLLHWGTWDAVGGFQRGAAPGVCQSEEYPFCDTLINILGGDIRVPDPHVVIHCGLTNSDGKDAPGRKEREAQLQEWILKGVYCE